MSWFDHGSAQIYYEEYGSGTPVLLLPGFAGSIEEFSVLKDALVKANYRVFAADLPGSGQSKPQPRLYPPTFYTDDARSFITFVEQVVMEPVHIAGFSDGGEVALLMAAIAPTAVRSIVTWGSSGVITEEHRPLIEVMANVVDNPIEQMQEFSAYLKSAYGESGARAMTQNFAAAVRAIIDNGGDISLSQAPNITCPVLLIAGEHDFFAPPMLVAQLAASIQSGKVLEVEGAGHSIHAERPEWLVQTILDWLGKR
ncbi:MAG: alpha/beta hydrolase [Candidatus Promineifilaceae bacterium]